MVVLRLRALLPALRPGLASMHISQPFRCKTNLPHRTAMPLGASIQPWHPVYIHWSQPAWGIPKGADTRHRAATLFMKRDVSKNGNTTLLLNWQLFWYFESSPRRHRCWIWCNRQQPTNQPTTLTATVKGRENGEIVSRARATCGIRSISDPCHLCETRTSLTCFLCNVP